MGRGKSKASLGIMEAIKGDSPIVSNDAETDFLPACEPTGN